MLRAPKRNKAKRPLPWRAQDGWPSRLWLSHLSQGGPTGAGPPQSFASKSGSLPPHSRPRGVAGVSPAKQPPTQENQQIEFLWAVLEPTWKPNICRMARQLCRAKHVTWNPTLQGLSRISADAALLGAIYSRKYCDSDSYFRLQFCSALQISLDT